MQPKPQRTHPSAVHLVLAAHMDDESLGLGAWISAWNNRRESVHVAFFTQGEPRNSGFFAHGDQAELYAARRRTEAILAGRSLGIPLRQLHFGGFPDLELARHLDPAWIWIMRLIQSLQPTSVYAPAYEGGHPDHDSINFLASHLSDRPGRRRIWEYPLYTQANGRVLYRSFNRSQGLELVFPSRASDRRRKRRALSCYLSQRSTLQYFPAAEERIRALPRHDYSRPPVEPTVYELWGWPWKSKELCALWSRFHPARG